MARLDDPALIALDWGTTALRGWLLDRKGAVLAQARAARGLMQIADGDFAGAFDAAFAGADFVAVLRAASFAAGAFFADLTAVLTTFFAGFFAATSGCPSIPL